MKISYKLEKHLPLTIVYLALPIPVVLAVFFWHLYNQPSENLVIQIGKFIGLCLLGAWAAFFLGSIVAKLMSLSRKAFRQKLLEQVEMEEAENTANAEKKRNEELKAWFEKGSASDNAFRLWYKLDALDRRLTRIEKNIVKLAIFSTLIVLFIVVAIFVPTFSGWLGKYLGFQQ